MVNPGRQCGGECFHVGDSYVWAEIQYLDSPTDYREFLPQYPIARKVTSDLVMLDSSKNTLMESLPLPLVFLTVVVTAILLAYFEL